MSLTATTDLMGSVKICIDKSNKVKPSDNQRNSDVMTTVSFVKYTQNSKDGTISALA